MDFLLLLHICAATVGLLSGYASVLVRKGGGLHRVAGSVFVIAMLAMSASGAYLATFRKPNVLSVTAALLTFYLVATGWWIGRHRDGSKGLFDVAALVFVTGVAVLGIASRSAASVFGVIALLFAASDVRALVRGGISGARRIARHLWRMTLALLIATLSLYPGQAKLFSTAARDSGLLFAPHVFLVAVMIFWLIRMRRSHNSTSEGRETAPSRLSLTIRNELVRSEAPR